MGEFTSRYRKIGRRLAFYREIRGLTQEQQSDMTNLSKSYISKIEAPNSTVAFSLDVLFTITDALKIDMTLLFAPTIREDIDQLDK